MTRGLRVWGSLWPLLPLLASCAQALGQETPGNGVVGASGLLWGQTPHTIRGTVVNSVTGEPIYRALVQIGGQFAALTDHEGHFEFEGVTENVRPWAMKPGYFPENSHRTYISEGSSVTTSSGGFELSGDQPVVVSLVPEAIITGTVTGEDGAPLAGIPVQLKFLTVQDGMPQWGQRQGTKTNSEGQYRFAELEAGKYFVTTGFRTEGLAETQGALAYVPVRYPPPGGGSSSGMALVLGPGDRLQADVSPEVEKLYPVTGTISGYAESRGVSFRVQTASGEEIAPVSRFFPRTGEFRLMLPGGTYRVTATAYMRQASMEATREVTVPQAPVSGVSFAMEPYATIPIDLEFETVNQPAEGSGQANGTAPQNYDGASIGLTGVDGPGRMLFLSAQPIRRPGNDDPAAPPGPLRIENVSPGRYLLRAQPQPPWYVSSASCGTVDLMREELTVGGTAVGCSIRILLRNDTGTLHVALRDAPEQNIGEAVFYALPLGDMVRQPVIASGWSPAYQGAEVAPVAPGRYLVLMLDHREELAYRDPEALRRYASLGQEVTVTANAKVDAEVSLIHGEP